MTQNNLKDFLDSKVELYNRQNFIKDDPVCIPHLFTKKQDIEIAAFFASIFAWGNRTIIINKSRELMRLMDMQPYAFMLNHSDKELKKLLQFRHRTFNTTDLLYFIEFLKFHYSHNHSLETAFSKWMGASGCCPDASEAFTASTPCERPVRGIAARGESSAAVGCPHGLKPVFTPPIITRASSASRHDRHGTFNDRADSGGT